MSDTSGAESVAYKIGDLVWAKLKGFSPWPGKVVAPPANMTKRKKGSECIYFYGTQNYAYVEVFNIRPYLKDKQKFEQACKTASFKKALEEIEKVLKFGDVEVADDPDAEFNRLRQPSPKTPNDKKEEKKKPKKEITKPLKRASDSNLLKPPKKIQVLESPSTSGSTSPPRKSRGIDLNSILERPDNLKAPVKESTINIQDLSTTVQNRNIVPSALTFGVLGLGIIGSNVVRNLANSGHKVVVWNRSKDKIENLEKIGVRELQTPTDVATEADVIICCVSDPNAVRELIFGNCGILSTKMLDKKAYVEMSGIDSETSMDVSEAIIRSGGRYLEAQIQGSKPQAEEGTLTILTAGDKSLFDDCETCFRAIGSYSVYLGTTGNATKLNLVLKLMTGIVIAGLAEGMALADRVGLHLHDVSEILGISNLACPEILNKCKFIIDNEYPTHMSVEHMQKDLRLVLNMGDTVEQMLPITAAANEVYKHTRRLGYGDRDVAAVYVRARF